MLHAECCEKGVHRWVPRRSSTPGPIAGSAEHANEVIMLCLSLAPALLYSVGFSCHRRQGTPGKAANHRCHIWHNEKTHERLLNEKLRERQGALHFSAGIKSKKKATGDLHME